MSKKIAVLIGSVREGSNTKAAAGFIGDSLIKAGFSLEIVDPKNFALFFPGQDGYETESKKVQGRLSSCEGVVMVTPEYDGTFSAVMKLLIEYMGYPSVLAGKPVALFGVAGGKVGAVKSLEHLRGVCGSTGMLVLPNSFSVANIHSVISDGKITDLEQADLFNQPAKELLSYFENKS